MKIYETPDELVKEMMQTYPSLFPSRIECWSHMFSCIGTGLDWDLESGCLCYELRDASRKPEDGPFLEEIEEGDDELYIFSKEHENLQRQHIWDNIDLVVGDYHYSTKRYTIFNIYPEAWDEPDAKYFSPGRMQTACIHRDKIKAVWRQEIATYCKWFIGQVHQFVYNPGRNKDEGPIKPEEVLAQLDECKSIRKMRELRNNYYLALMVLKGILTPDETAAEVLHAKRMQKMFDDILKGID